MKYKLWDAILEGCKVTKPIHGMWVMAMNGKVHYACAMGAAMVAEKGINYDEYDFNGIRAVEMYTEYMLIDLNCPVCKSNKPHNIINMVTHLNDLHKWPRENIAFWLRDQLEPKAEEVKEVKEEECMMMSLSQSL